MKKYFLYILLTIFSVCNVHAEFNLLHKTGAYSELQENDMQKVHTDYQIMYAKPGETVSMDYTTYKGVYNQRRNSGFDPDGSAIGELPTPIGGPIVPLLILVFVYLIYQQIKRIKLT